MQLADFDYSLPEDLIAQTPPERRDAARLMCLQRSTGTIEARRFPEIVGYFEPGDVLVLNDTRVIPARLAGRKVTGGKVEIFLVRPAEEPDLWWCLTRSSRSLRAGSRIVLGEDFRAEVLAAERDGYRLVRFECTGDFLERVEDLGAVPLPPYIKRPGSDADRERYQTVFARHKGAVAAPTAGLHFTDEILARLRERQVAIAPLTLHVGLGTFLPVRVDDIREHRMHAEWYAIPEETARLVNRARRAGRRIFALGTTSARALESAADDAGELSAGTAESEIFIYPGYRFRTVDVLITNFHLPKSTLLMLVSAFAGREFVLQAYRRAVAERYRFFSYGDCMLIL